MLKLDLGRLGREGSVLVEGRISADDALWEGSGLEWTGPVDLRLRISSAVSGEVIGRGSVKGTLDQVCRRCLEPVTTEFVEDLTLVFVDDDSDAEFEDGGAFVLKRGSAELDLGSAVREEVLLAINPYVVCDPDCPGLCPECGANLKEGDCGCARVESDSRWDALRELKG
jgi:uncharacterized protein